MYLKLSLGFWTRIGVCGLLLGTLLPLPVTAQSVSWKRQLGTSSYDDSRGVATDSNGNVYIAGTTYGSMFGSNPDGDADAWVAKYNSAGTLVWKRQLGTSSYDYSTGAATDSNGNIYITGTTYGSMSGSNPDGDLDAWIAKYNSAGTLVWKRQWGSSSRDESNILATDSNGNVYITGTTYGSMFGSNQDGEPDAWIAKYNSSGTRVWQQQLGTSTNDYSYGVATDSNGNVYITGYTNGSWFGSNQGSYDAWVAKYNIAGTLVWKRQLGTSANDSSYGVATDSNGNVYITGYTHGSMSGSNPDGEPDAWIAKYNSAGTLVWKRQWGSSRDDYSSSVATDSNGNVYITGYTNGSMFGFNQGSYDVWVAKYNSSGTRVWQQQLGASNWDSSNDVETDSKGNVYITGITYGSWFGSNQGYYDAWVVKYTQ